jgi:hypothetical protein
VLEGRIMPAVSAKRHSFVCVASAENTGVAATVDVTAVRGWLPADVHPHVGSPRRATANAVSRGAAPRDPDPATPSSNSSDDHGRSNHSRGSTPAFGS